MQMVLFGLVATLIWGGAHFYVGYRLIAGSALDHPWDVIAWVVLAAHAALAPVAFGVRRAVPESPLVDVLEWAAYVGMGFFVLVFTLVVARDVIGLLVRLVERLFGRGPIPDDPERRQMLASAVNLGVFATAGVGTTFGFAQARRTPDVERVDVEVDGLHPDLDGFRIVQISDIHAGPTIKRPFVQAVIDVVNGLDADLVALTGDLVDGYVDDMRHDVAPVADARARLKKYFVTGNHEYYWDAPAWCAEAERLGYRTLTNEHELLQVGGARLLVAGVTDYSAERFEPENASSPKKAMAAAPDHDYSILLAHQPKSVFEAAEAGFDLQLSGHTHGGQFYPWNFLVGLAHPFTAGLHRFAEKLTIYVSRGTGYWGPPLRLGVPSEITLLTLRRT